MAFALPADYWQNLTITSRDIEFLQNHLFETETPLTITELAEVLIEERLRLERLQSEKEQQARGRVYLPKEHFAVGESVVFPALAFKRATITAVRPAANPELPAFEVLEADFGGERRLFAAGLEDHKLNAPLPEPDAESLAPAAILAAAGTQLESRLASALQADENLVCIAARWFPRALLVDVNTGHLNLAEAVLEMSGGEPMTAEALMAQIDLPSDVNPKLAEFSLNYALQEDDRFDEVGPAGQVLWCLQRLEPEEVRNTPELLRYTPLAYDRALLTRQMIALESELDDELGETPPPDGAPAEVTLCLVYPHWRSGTLPISARLRSFFPTAYESARVRFTLVDGRSGERIPAWVVRREGYVFGLKAWFERMRLVPGALVTVKRSKVPGEVIIEARTRRPTRDWVRTVLTGSDGGLVFALLKQDIACEYNERMITVVPDVEAVDVARQQAVKSRQPLEQFVAGMVRELSKLTPQGHVHAQELYSAANLLRRLPPGPLLHLLATSPLFTHVGDMHYRLGEAGGKDE